MANAGTPVEEGPSMSLEDLTQIKRGLQDHNQLLEFEPNSEDKRREYRRKYYQDDAFLDLDQETLDRFHNRFVSPSPKTPSLAAARS